MLFTMKRNERKKTVSPTLGGVVKSVQDLTLAVQSGFQHMEARFDGVENRLGGVEGRLGEVEQELRGVSRRVGSLEEKVEDMDETLSAVAKAVDKDAVTILDHERRIVKLEKVRA